MGLILFQYHLNGTVMATVIMTQKISQSCGISNRNINTCDS